MGIGPSSCNYIDESQPLFEDSDTASEIQCGQGDRMKLRSQSTASNISDDVINNIALSAIIDKPTRATYQSVKAILDLADMIATMQNVMVQTQGTNAKILATLKDLKSPVADSMQQLITQATTASTQGQVATTTALAASIGTVVSSATYRPISVANTAASATQTHK